MHETHFQISGCYCSFSTRWYKLYKLPNCAECSKAVNWESPNVLFLWQFLSSVCFLFPRYSGCIYWVGSVYLDTRKWNSKVMKAKARQCCLTVAGTPSLAGRVYMHAGATEIEIWRQTLNTGGCNIWTVAVIVLWAVHSRSVIGGLRVCIKISWATWDQIMALYLLTQKVDNHAQSAWKFVSTDSTMWFFERKMSPANDIHWLKYFQDALLIKELYDGVHSHKYPKVLCP
jgi:hypothetical protein